MDDHHLLVTGDQETAAQKAESVRGFSLRRSFGLDEDFVRPRPEVDRTDLLLTGVVVALCAVQLELTRSMGLTRDYGSHPWTEYPAILSAALALVWRRRFPIVVMAYTFGHFFVISHLVPTVAFNLSYQIISFIGLYAAAAWARERRGALICLGAVMVWLFAWLAWDLAVGSGTDRILFKLNPTRTSGLFPPVTAAVMLLFLLNTAYFVGAIAIGLRSWWRAHDRALLVEQNHTISAQSLALQKQAVVDERLRIARELHDVVAHYVAVMGIQAGLARTWLDRDTTKSRDALQAIEEASRQTISQMHGLLGTLRDTEPDDSRVPEPSLSGLDALVEEMAGVGLRVELTTIGPDPSDDTLVPLLIQLACYRVVQEALANVLRHSTARAAKVTIRATPSFIEVEVLDDGRPLPGIPGTGMGLLGMRERVRAHHGTIEVGPRVVGGYRVRARIPLKAEVSDE